MFYLTVVGKAEGTEGMQHMAGRQAGVVRVRCLALQACEHTRRGQGPPQSSRILLAVIAGVAPAGYCV